jgi:hypothetical protein
MTFHRGCADEPDLVPPAELLRHRNALVQPPSPRTRSRHLAAITAAAREHSASPAGRFASRSVRGAAAVVATLAITSGLAAAQVLPAPAQRIFSSVSGAFSPDAPPATAGDPDDTDATSLSTAPAGPDTTGGVLVPADTTSSSDGVTSSSADTIAPSSTATPTTAPPATPTTLDPTTTTIPGPTDPGSSDGPTDPGSTDGGPTDPGPTDPGSTDGGPTDPGSDDGTVSTTEVPPTTTDTTGVTGASITPEGGPG